VTLSTTANIENHLTNTPFSYRFVWCHSNSYVILCSTTYDKVPPVDATGVLIDGYCPVWPWTIPFMCGWLVGWTDSNIENKILIGYYTFCCTLFPYCIAKLIRTFLLYIVRLLWKIFIIGNQTSIDKCTCTQLSNRIIIIIYLLDLLWEYIGRSRGTNADCWLL